MSSNLAEEHCDPSNEALTEDEANRLENGAPAWTRNGLDTLTREFQFENFRDAFGFVARAALIAEREFHHPDIELGWGRAAFTLTTHSKGGLTRNDFIIAAKIGTLEVTGATQS